MNPARLPTELITAIPAAADAPRRNAVGNVQNNGTTARIPIVAHVSASIPTVSLPVIRPAIASPKAPNSAPTTRCQRRSFMRSEFCPYSTIVIAATPYGIALRNPTRSGSCTPMLRMSCGSQKAMPYSPITNEKYNAASNSTRGLRIVSPTDMCTPVSCSASTLRCNIDFSWMDNQRAPWIESSR